MEVALFVPCYVDQLAPSVGLATVAVLERAGCRVAYHPDQTCCGQPFLNLGAARQAARLARAHLARFVGCDAVVCPSASCVSHVRHGYPALGVAWDAAARRVQERTFELGEFLVCELGVTGLGARFPHRVALLQSCRGLRQLGLGSQSERGARGGATATTRTLLERVEGLELTLPERPDECCGFGGAFCVAFPEISTRIGSDRLRALAATGAEYVTGTDASCLLHLEGIRLRTGAGPRFLHLAEILAAGHAG